MELTNAKTNLMQKIISLTGFATKKDTKKAKDTASPKAKGKSMTGTAGKSTGKKKGLGTSGKKSPDLEMLVTIN